MDDKNETVEIKQELIDCASMKLNEKKRDSYHTKRKRLQIGDIVTACVGPPKVSAKGKRLQGNQRRYGEILKSVGNNTYLVAFEDLQLLELGSRSLRKVKSEDVILQFKQVLNQIVSGYKNNDIVKGSTDDTDDIAAVNEVNDESIDPFRLVGLMQEGQYVDKLMEDDNLGPPAIEQSCSEDDSSINSTPTPTPFTTAKTKPSTLKRRTKSKPLPPVITTNKKPSKLKLKRRTKSKPPSSKSLSSGNKGDIYKTRLNDFQRKIDDMATDGTTYTVCSAKDSMDWSVVSDTVVIQPGVKPRCINRMGIRDTKKLQKIKDDPLSMAELYLELSYENGEYERHLEVMNKKIAQHNNIARRKKETNKTGKLKIVPEFSKSEFLTGSALVIGAADCSEKGSNLWKSKPGQQEEWEKHWVSFAHHTDFNKYMRQYRFQQFRAFYPMIWEDEGLRQLNDPWWKFAGAIKQFNENRKSLLLPSEIIAIDETMSAFRPQTTKFGGMPNICFVMRKPEDLGLEFKSAVCPLMGVMTYLEIQRGKEDMRERSEFFSEIGATASCGLRAAKACSHKTGMESEELVIGDSWFGSVKAAVAQAQAGFQCVFQVKQNHALYPKKQLEEVLNDAPGGVSMILSGTHSSGLHLIAIGYKYNSKTVLCFICTEGAGSTAEGKPYEMKWTDECGNINVRNVPRPQIISQFFANCNGVDIHNHLRQYCLRLEKKWITADCWFRLSTTLMGINTVDTFRLARFHNMLPKGQLKIVLNDIDSNDTNTFSMKKFAGILCTQLLYKAQILREEKPKSTHGYDSSFSIESHESNRGCFTKERAMDKKKRSSNESSKKRKNANDANNPSWKKKKNKKVVVIDSSDSEGETLQMLLNGGKRKKCTVGDNAFKPLDLEESATLSDNDSGCSSWDEDFVPTWRQLHKRYGKDNIACEMKDLGSNPHTAVKLCTVVSRGQCTQGRKYATRRKCKWCGERSTFKCFQCNRVYCFSSNPNADWTKTCFYRHVNSIRSPKRVARRANKFK